MNKRHKRGFPPPYAHISLCEGIRLEIHATDSCTQQIQNQSAFQGISKSPAAPYAPSN